jgi:dTDP-4-dehydrorhamnose reductase
MIALLGASGYIGSRFRTHLDGQGTAYAPISRADLNIFDPVELARALDDLSADFLINCAGYTGKPNVDGAARIQ